MIRRNLLVIVIILSVLLIATTTPYEMVECKPQTPKSVVVKTFRGYTIEVEMKSYIDQSVSQGYIVKSVTMSEDESFAKGIVVVEKY